MPRNADSNATSTPDIILGCSTSLGLAPIAICEGLFWRTQNFPRPASNLEVFDLSDAVSPQNILEPGGNGRVVRKPTNFVPPDLWDPNTWPDRIEVTPQGIAVASFNQNIEFFSRTLALSSRGFVGRVKGLREFLGR